VGQYLFRHHPRRRLTARTTGAATLWRGTGQKCKQAPPNTAELGSSPTRTNSAEPLQNVPKPKVAGSRPVVRLGERTAGKVWGGNPDAARTQAGDHAAVAIQRLTIEIEDSPLPRGHVVGEGGREQSFTGWIELAAAIDAARLKPEDAAEGPLRVPSGEG
jgi:hypothetical protein